MQSEILKCPMTNMQLILSFVHLEINAKFSLLFIVL